MLLRQDFSKYENSNCYEQANDGDVFPEDFSCFHIDSLHKKSIVKGRGFFNPLPNRVI
jgi:hypothetical protein